MPKKLLYDDLVGELYNLSTEADNWTLYGELLRSAFEADTSLALYNPPNNGPALILETNFPERFIRAYNSEWYRNDPWRIGGLRGVQAGRLVIRGSDIIPTPKFINSPIYNEVIKTDLDTRFLLALGVPIDGGWLTIGIHRAGRSPDFGQREIALIDRLRPHIQRSRQIASKLSIINQKYSSAQKAIDELNTGIIVVDSACRPIVINRHAEALLLKRDGLILQNARSPIITQSSIETAHLHHMVTQSAADRLAGGAMWVGRASDGPPYRVLVAPLIGHRAQTLSPGQPAALVLIEDSSVKPRPSASVLRDLYSLTPAEALLAIRLSTGETLEDVAKEKEIQISTARSQLKSIFSKMEISRQSDLSRLVTRLALTR